MDANESVMLFTLLGDVYVEGELVEEKTAVKLTEGDSVYIKNGDEKAQVLYISSKALNEPISWAGPIVMNSKEEIKEALDELNKGIFIKEKLEY
ncbi:pirin-like C-terminal cupin domain-containing protein [Peptacetobacter sp.]|uniref:pirin-like C-terminal cupin domain-containing protein n=1 Tax=Peptacetobacter sp. TaxID=2991975 RepID=UPI002FE6DD58